MVGGFIANNNALKDMADRLWKEPTTRNWEAFRKVLIKSNAKYYRPIFANGKVRKLDDLKKSWVILYDRQRKIITKVPVYRRIPSGIEGALIYLRGMLNANVVE